MMSDKEVWGADGVPAHPKRSSVELSSGLCVGDLSSSTPTLVHMGIVILDQIWAPTEGKS